MLVGAASVQLKKQEKTRALFVRSPLVKIQPLLKGVSRED
jgi:hypothetical protein